MRDEAGVTGEAADGVGAPPVRAAASPARSAWVEAAYRAHARELWAVFYAKGCDAELAREAVQEAFLRLQGQEPETLRDVRAWLIRVGHNWMRDRHRRAKHAARSGPGLDEMAAEFGGPVESLLEEEQKELIRASLAELREEDRRVLVLRYALDWPSARIAEALDASPAAIDMRLSRARKRLGEILRERGMLNE